MRPVLSHAQQGVFGKWRRETPFVFAEVAQKGDFDIALEQQMQRGSSHCHFAYDDHVIYFCQRDDFLARWSRGRTILPFPLRNLDEQAIFTIAPHNSIFFSEIQSWHECLLSVHENATFSLRRADRAVADCSAGSAPSMALRAAVAHSQERPPRMPAQ